MQRNSWQYIIGFAGLICVFCSLLVSTAVVALKERQGVNALLDKQKKVLSVAGLIDPKAPPQPDEVRRLFDSRIHTHVVNLQTGEEVPPDQIDPATYDQQKALSDPNASREAPSNRAQVQRLPNFATIYQVLDDSEKVESLILPVVGKGLWSTMYGFIALGRDTTTVKGLIFYAHGETPGLGGEIENPLWTAKWPGRKIFDEEWQPAIRVIKGFAKGPEEAPHDVDGLSGATITSNGVTYLVQFWLGENGFGPYLAKFRETEGR